MRMKSNLRQLLKDRNISYHVFVEQSNVSYPTIVKYANDNLKSYDSVVIAKICMALKCKISDLLILDEEKEN